MPPFASDTSGLEQCACQVLKPVPRILGGSPMILHSHGPPQNILVHGDRTLQVSFVFSESSCTCIGPHTQGRTARDWCGPLLCCLRSGHVKQFCLLVVLRRGGGLCVSATCTVSIAKSVFTVSSTSTTHLCASGSMLD